MAFRAILPPTMRISCRSTFCRPVYRRSFTTKRNEDCEDFYRYTSGRWLWDEKARLPEFYKKFNVPALKHIVAKSVGAQECVAMTKFAEQDSGKLFRLEMDNGAVAIAKIPVPISGPASLSTASEVATTDFASTILGIPTPKVLSWSATAENAVESEYFIREQARGTRLNELWDDMGLEMKINIVHQLIAMEKKMLSVSLNRYGSLYYANGAPKGCDPLKIEANISSALRANAQERFVVGPSLNSTSWEGERAVMNVDRGPWRTPAEMLRAIADAEITFITSHADSNERCGFPTEKSEVQHSRQAHLDLYNKFIAVLDYLVPTDKALQRSVIWHWNMAPHNIFVENEEITALTSWWQISAAPLFMQARTPSLVKHMGKQVFELPDDYETLDEARQEFTRKALAGTAQEWIYDHARMNFNPALQRVYDYPHSGLLKKTIAFAENTWDGDIALLRDCLIKVAESWSSIAPNAGPCPISFTPEDYELHYRDGPKCNEKADFWDFARDLVQDDGWVRNEHYDLMLQTFGAAREETLKDLEGEEREAFERVMRWAKREGRE